MERLLNELADDLSRVASQVRQIIDALGRACDALENERIRRRDLVYVATQIVKGHAASEQADERLERILHMLEGLKRFVREDAVELP